MFYVIVIKKRFEKKETFELLIYRISLYGVDFFLPHIWIVIII